MGGFSSTDREESNNSHHSHDTNHSCTVENTSDDSAEELRRRKGNQCGKSEKSENKGEQQGRDSDRQCLRPRMYSKTESEHETDSESESLGDYNIYKESQESGQHDEEHDKCKLHTIPCQLVCDHHPEKALELLINCDNHVDSLTSEELKMKCCSGEMNRLVEGKRINVSERNGDCEEDSTSTSYEHCFSSLECVQNVDAHHDDMSASDISRSCQQTLGNEDLLKCQKSTGIESDTSAIHTKKRTESQGSITNKDPKVRESSHENIVCVSENGESKTQAVNDSPFRYVATDMNVGNNKMKWYKQNIGQVVSMKSEKELKLLLSVSASLPELLNQQISYSESTSATNKTKTGKQMLLSSKHIKNHVKDKTSNDGIGEKDNGSDFVCSDMGMKYWHHRNSTHKLEPQALTVFMFKAEQKPELQDVAPLPGGLENEWNRIASFCNFQPPTGVYILPIANNGFYHPNSNNVSDDHVKIVCVFCRVSVAITQFRGRRAADVHKRFSPSCRFILGAAVGNISISDSVQAPSGLFPNPPISSKRHEDVPSGYSGSAGLPNNSISKKQVEALVTDCAGAFAVEGSVANYNATIDCPISKASVASQSFDTARIQGESGSSSYAQQARLPTVLESTNTVSNLAEQASNSALQQESGSNSLQNTGSSDGSTIPHQTAAPHGLSQTATVENSTMSESGSETRGSETGAAHQAGSNTGSASSAQGTEGNGGSASEAGTERQAVTYEDLGIYAQAPKRPDMAVMQVRINTYSGWPHNDSHPPVNMAEAGFYYTGHFDLVRCFHCKGGLKTWESSDNPWIEHTRWFPRCDFIKLCKGKKFVEAVKHLNNPETKPPISMEDVSKEMKRMTEAAKKARKQIDVACAADAIDPASARRSSLEALSQASLRIDAEITEAGMEDIQQQLQDENEEMKSITLCKMCQSNQVNVLFLPCGHLVACSQCAPALRSCAMCRQTVKGSVRVLLDEDDTEEEEEEEEQHQTHSSNAVT